MKINHTLTIKIIIILLTCQLIVIHPAHASDKSRIVPTGKTASGANNSSALLLPSPFGKITPASSALNVDTSITLSWSPSSGANGYETCIDTINNNSCDSSWSFSPVNPYIAIDGLLTGKVYYWQVRAKSLSGDTYADGGSWWQFTTIPTFLDVPYNYWAWDFIERLYRGGLTAGCHAEPLLFCPFSLTLRSEMAVFMVQAKWGPHYIPSPGTGYIFTDVPITYWAVDYIERIYWFGITNGCSLSPLRYCPENPVKRSEMAVLLLRAKYGSSYVPQPPVGLFNDVPPSHWAAGFIEALFAEGITSGCSSIPLNYCPENYVTRDQMATFLVRAFNLP